VSALIVLGIIAGAGLTAYLGLWAAFFIVGMLPDAGDYE
jgi:hypothetical protein